MNWSRLSSNFALVFCLKILFFRLVFWGGEGKSLRIRIAFRPEQKPSPHDKQTLLGTNRVPSTVLPDFIVEMCQNSNRSDKKKKIERSRARNDCFKSTKTIVVRDTEANLRDFSELTEERKFLPENCFHICSNWIKNHYTCTSILNRLNFFIFEIQILIKKNL